MFGHRYFGGAYFGPRYFGDGGVAVVTPPSPGGGSGGVGVGGYAYDYNVRTLVRHIERPVAPEFNLKELELIRAEWQANVRMLEQDIALIEEAALALLDY